MTKPERVRYLCLAIAALGLAVLACTPSIGGRGNLPTVKIVSPESGSSAVADEPVRVEVKAEDPKGAGVIQVDLQMDGLTVDTFTVDGPQASLGASLTCTPSEEGTRTLTAIAYRPDGTASLPVTISLNVEAAASQTAAEEETAEEPVQARADLNASVRDRPGTDCPIIGQVPRDAVIVLLRRTSSPTDYWYQTDYLGEDKLGWVHHDPLTLLGDDGDLPREREQNCPFCGDGTCSAAAGETCGTCANDCGACSSSGAGGGQCGDGICQAGESPDWCGDCVEEQTGPVCGDGKCSGGQGETCSTCQADCGACDPACGNGKCETGEDCFSCPADCNQGDISNPCCGDGACGLFETCDTCPGDCGSCCGNLWCDHGETASTCPIDCLCGNGFVEPGEDCDPPGAWCGRDLVGVDVVEFFCTSNCKCNK